MGSTFLSFRVRQGTPDLPPSYLPDPVIVKGKKKIIFIFQKFCLTDFKKLIGCN